MWEHYHSLSLSCLKRRLREGKENGTRLDSSSYLVCVCVFLKEKESVVVEGKENKAMGNGCVERRRVKRITWERVC